MKQPSAVPPETLVRILAWVDRALSMAKSLGFDPDDDDRIKTQIVIDLSAARERLRDAAGVRAAGRVRR